MKFGYIGLIGPTNAGKSSLFNNFCGLHASAVSHKINTTSTYVSMTLEYNQDKIILLDTPGVFDPDIKSMFDCAILVHDARKPAYDFQPFCKTILCINKIDFIAQKTALLPLAADFNKNNVFDDIFFVSAKKSDYTVDLFEHAIQHLPSYDTDELNIEQKYSLEEMAFNVVKELVFRHLHDEIPYNVQISNAIIHNSNIHIEISSKKNYKHIINRKVLNFLQQKALAIINARAANNDMHAMRIVFKYIK